MDIKDGNTGETKTLDEEEDGESPAKSPEDAISVLPVVAAPAVESPKEALERRYYEQMDIVEKLRAEAGQAQEEFERMKIQLEFIERALERFSLGRPYRTKDEGLMAIIGTVSMGWVDYKAQEPYPDSSKPQYRSIMRPKDEKWHRLACALALIAPLLATGVSNLALRLLDMAPFITETLSDDTTANLVANALSLFS